MRYNWIVKSEERLLPFIKKELNEAKTKELRWAVEHNRCKVNGKIERFCSRRLKANDNVELVFEVSQAPEIDTKAILFEDDVLVAYNKPAGIASDALAKILKLRLVHRLDRDTTGVILFAKNEKVQEALENLFKAREITKIYVALALGKIVQSRFEVENYLAPVKRREGAVVYGTVLKNGSFAKTTFIVDKATNQYSLCRCIPHTGRTHQIRVHLSGIGHPIIGDVEYGSKSDWSSFRPLLHAHKISFVHPTTNKKMTIIPPIADDISKVLESVC